MSATGFHATIAKNFMGGESSHYIHIVEQRVVEQVFRITLNDLQEIPPSQNEDI